MSSDCFKVHVYHEIKFATKLKMVMFASTILIFTAFSIDHLNFQNNKLPFCLNRFHLYLRFSVALRSVDAQYRL